MRNWSSSGKKTAVLMSWPAKASIGGNPGYSQRLTVMNSARSPYGLPEQPGPAIARRALVALDSGPLHIGRIRRSILCPDRSPPDSRNHPGHLPASITPKRARPPCQYCESHGQGGHGRLGTRGALNATAPKSCWPPTGSRGSGCSTGTTRRAGARSPACRPLYAPVSPPHSTPRSPPAWDGRPRALTPDRRTPLPRTRALRGEPR